LTLSVTMQCSCFEGTAVFAGTAWRGQGGQAMPFATQIFI